jgi:hypothetical protein
MRVMVLVKASKDSEAGVLPTADELAEMGRYNEQLVNAGIMLDGDGLRPTSKGAKIKFNGDKKTLIDGPFTETKEIVAGYWVWQVKSWEEALEWAQRCPNPSRGEGEIEIRQFFEAEDFAPSDPSGKLLAAEADLRARAKAQHGG